MSSNEESNSKKPMFRDLDASEADGELEISEVESLCMNCEKKVRVGLHKITKYNV